jgi:acyl transferase domain-containing protein
MSSTALNKDYRSLMQEAIRKLETTQAKLKALEQIRSEPIAIIGMGCRFPGSADTPAAYWNLLRQGVDAIVEVPPDRWNMDAYYDPNPDAPGKSYVRKGGFLSGIDRFDPQFFDISPREAVGMDPQQRLWLEVCWEALEDANLAPDQLYQSLTGVFVGISGFDFAGLLAKSLKPEAIDAYLGTSASLNMPAGRLSYTLGLTGPSMAIDTACSSSLTAVHLACQSLRNRDCHLALAGGVNIILLPETYVAFSRARLLAPDGHCKTFDDSADGFVRSEGCGAIVLKRLSDAQADGDRILALIRGSAVNQDGASGGLTVPSGPSQQAVIRQALANAGVQPHQIGYLEAHGTGTSLGDPIEMEALAAVFGNDPLRQQPFAVGSVKTNLGHLEAGAGIAGLMKVLLALQHREIPPHLHFRKPSPRISWDKLPAKVPTQLMAWAAGQDRRIAGVSSFGLSGTNAHAILEEAPDSPAPASTKTNAAGKDRSVHLLAISAKSEKALRQLASRYQTHLDANADLALADICYSANLCRSRFQYRLGVAASTSAELSQALAAFASGRDEAEISHGEVQPAGRNKVAFLFTGQGSQYVGMGLQLYESQPVFRENLDRCGSLLHDYLPKPLREILFSGPTESSILHETGYTQPALFALEYSLAQFWKSIGIEPAALLGHSLGEYVAACVAGVFSLEDGMRLVVERARLMQALPSGGGMVALPLSVAEALAACAPHSQEVSIAALNGPNNTVLSGPWEALESILSRLSKQGIKATRLNVSHAFHSPLMEPMLAEFERVARQVAYSTPEIPLISNVTGRIATAEMATPEYWVNHIRQPVRFASGMDALSQFGCRLFLEVGPKPVLLGMGRQCLPGDFGLWLPSLRPGLAEWRQILQSLGALFVQGVAVDWAGLDRGVARRKVALPLYPFQRERYWISTPAPEKVMAETAAPATATTSVLQCIQQGDSDRLTKRLQESGELSEETTKVLPELLRVLIEQHRREAESASLNQLLYELQWMPKPTTSARNGSRSEVGCWLIFADQKGFGRALSDRLLIDGNPFHLVFPGDRFEKMGKGICLVNPAEESHFRQLLEEIKAPLRGVVHLWSLDAPESRCLTQASLLRSQLMGCGSALHLIKALLNSSAQSCHPRLWFVTQGAQCITPGVLQVAQSLIWGLGKVLALEHPQLWGGMVDLASEWTCDEAVAGLVQEIQNPDWEDHIAFRNGQRYVARLARGSVGESKPYTCPADAAYLITGGLGALGLAVGRWLIDRGARHLTLVGRRPPTPEVAVDLDSLRTTGADVRIHQADVSNESEMIRVLAEMDAAGVPLRGVIHAAGVPGYESLRELDFKRFESVLRPKVEGSWVLHELTKNRSLEFFVGISTMASIWGAEKQAHYVAGNHFLDTLIRYRRGLGLPGLSLNLGPLSGGGMVPEESLTEFGRIGVRAVSPSQVTEALGRLLQAGCPQMVLADIEWGRFKEVFEARGQRPIFEAMPADGELRETTAQPRSNWLQQRERLSAQDRHDFVVAYLQKQAGEVLKRESTHFKASQPLTETGLDSLMAVELRQRVRTDFAVELPIVKFLDGSTFAILAERVNEMLHGETPGVLTSAPLPQALSLEEQKLEELENMGDQDVDRLLRSLLKSEEQGA